MDYKFYDTSSLLNGYKYQFFNRQDKKVISSTTLKQLEDMKPSETAEFVLSYIYQHPEEFEIYFFKLFFFIYMIFLILLLSICICSDSSKIAFLLALNISS